MTPRVRFAPSPTGRLHVGNIRIALANWLFAQSNGGEFLLRMDDTDIERSKPEYEEGIMTDLAWLGITHDLFERQSDRHTLYDAAVQKLKDAGRLYPCYETREELDMKRKLQLSRGLPPKYDRGALDLTEDQKKAYEEEGRKPHWRLLLTDDPVDWDDMVHGAIHFDGDQLTDPVLIREDGRPIYTLSSVVDDLDLGITHVIRGDDHIANTAVQVQLIQALGHDPRKITFAHMPLLTAADGSGLSKRLGSLSIEQLREEGILSIAVTSHLATLGTSDNVHLADSLDQLIQEFDIGKTTKNSPKFSLDELKSLNTQAIQGMSFAQAKEHITADIDESFWLLIRENIESFSEVSVWEERLFGDITPIIHDPDYIAVALNELPADPWDEETWKVWTSTLKEKTGRKGKELFMPLRQALTAQDHGPEMKKVLPLIGYERAKQRLSQGD